MQLPSRKAAALLAYLALNQGRVLARTELAALLWADTTSDHARHSLAQALYSLRRCLPTLVIDAGRQHIYVPETALVVDVVRLKGLIADGSLLDAIRLYEGPFLQGFSLPSCPEFDEWQELTRSEIERTIWRAARTLMESAEKRCAWDILEEVTARALLADPYDEAVHRRRLIALAMLGDIRRASREHEAFTKRIRTELERSPSPETIQLAERLSRLSQARDTGVRDADSSELDWPFVGREAELAVLRDAWREVRSGRSRAVAVVGEAGIGKSRLCQRFLRYAVLQGARVLEGRCYRLEARLPYSAAVDALLTGLRPEDIANLPPAWAAAISQLLPELAHANSDSVAPAPDETARRTLFEALARALESVSKRSPVVVFLDDLHWADDSTASLLHYLARKLRACQVMFLVALRPEELGADSNIGWLYQEPASFPLFQELRLDRLPRASIEAIIDQFEEQTHLRIPSDVRELIARRAIGVPLFIIELLKALRDGRGSEEAVSCGIGEGVRDFVPAVINDLYARRIKGLGNEALEVISALAVLGRGASARLVSRVTGRSIAATVQGVEELLSRGLIADDNGTLKLPHDLLREVVYRSLSPARRRMMHSAVANALVAEADTRPAMLAVHYDLAGEREAAYSYALRAAEVSERVYAPAEIDFFLRMAHANADSDEDRWRLQERRGHVLYRFRRYREADEIFRELEAHYRAIGDRNALLACEVVRANIRAKQGRIPPMGMLNSLQRLLADAESLSQERSLPQIIKLLAAAAHDVGSQDVVLEMIRRLRHIAAEAASATVAAEALTVAGSLSGLYTSAREGLQYSKGAVRNARRSGDRAVLIHALLARGSNWLHLGRLCEAERDYRRALELGECHAIIDYRNGALNDLAILLTERGQFEEAAELLQRAARHATEAEAWHDLLFVEINRSLLELEAGDLDSAAETARAALGISGQVGAWWAQATALAVLGLYALERGQLTEANRCRREILSLFEGRDFWVGDFSYAEMFLARLAAVEGEEEKGLERLDRAVAAYEGRDALCWCRLQLERARLLLNLDRAEARRTARRVRSRAARAGARPLVAKAEAILDRLMVKD